MPALADKLKTHPSTEKIKTQSTARLFKTMRDIENSQDQHGDYETGVMLQVIGGIIEDRHDLVDATMELLEADEDLTCNYRELLGRAMIHTGQPIR